MYIYNISKKQLYHKNTTVVEQYNPSFYKSSLENNTLGLEKFYQH